jgi:uncharacterized protein YkwD
VAGPSEARLTKTRWRRAGAGIVLAVALMASPLLVSPVEASRPLDEGTVTVRAMTRGQLQVLDLINRARTARGRRAISTNGLMNQKAMNWAVHLRSIQDLDHRAPPFGAPRGWCAAAENVGRSGDGGTILATHRAFMASSGHRTNILNGRYTDVGIGVARDRGGEWFVVHAFADLAC